MKNYFAYTTLAALAVASLVSRPALAQESLAITIDTDDIAIAAPAQIAAPPAIAIAGDDNVYNYTYTFGGYDTLAGLNDVPEMERQLNQLDAKIKALKDSIRAASADTNRRASLERELSRTEETRDSFFRQIDRTRRMAPLSKLVDVKFDQATVKQAAEALSKAAGIEIRAEDSIPDSTRLTVEARKVKLSTVLESIARQSGLILEPINLEGRGNLGVLLSQQPMLRVNDNVIRTPKQLSPWSDKWGNAPGHRFLFSAPSGFGVLNGTQSAEAIGQYTRALKNVVVPGVATALSSLNGETVMRVNGGTTIKVNKDGTVTMIEPGKNDKGEDGYWTTTYNKKNGELVLDKKSWSKTK